MKKRSKAIWLWSSITVLTLLLYVMGNMGTYPSRALPFVWAFFSWNFYAYGFSGDMWPFQFVELKKAGHQLAREVVFWATAGVYLMLLATLAWA
jgi:hypothetical protein